MGLCAYMSVRLLADRRVWMPVTFYWQIFHRFSAFSPSVPRIFFHVRPGKHANDIELSFILWQLSFFAQYQH